MKVKTESFKDLVNRVAVGASNNKLRPITQLMLVSGKGTEVTAVTTDGTNYLYVYDETDKEVDFYAVVPVEQFSKLISKMTSEYIELFVENDVLTVIGNGEYTIELPLDENGKAIVYPDPYDEFINKKHHVVEGEINVSDIKTILESVKPSLMTTYEDPTYTNYYVGDNVVATDHSKIAGFNKALLDVDGTSAKLLISTELMNLLDVIETGPILYQLADNILVFEADDCVIVGKEANGLDDFEIDGINGLLNTEFPSVCKVNKQDLLNLLDRMSLFVGKYDDNALKLIFEKEHIVVTNKNQKSSEIIDYKDSKDFKSFECIIDVPTFVTQIKAYAGDVIELHYGREESVKLIDGDLTHIIALNE